DGAPRTVMDPPVTLFSSNGTLHHGRHGGHSTTLVWRLPCQCSRAEDPRHPSDDDHHHAGSPAGTTCPTSSDTEAGAKSRLAAYNARSPARERPPHLRAHPEDAKKTHRTRLGLFAMNIVKRHLRLRRGPLLSTFYCCGSDW